MGQAWPRSQGAASGPAAASDLSTAPDGPDFSTAGVEPVHQFGAYRQWMSSVADLRPTDPAASRLGFAAAQTVWRFGGLRLVRETCDAVEGRTTAAWGRPSAVDHWVVALHKAGDISVRSGDSVRRTTAGGVCFVTLTQAAHLRQEVSETLFLFIPRDQVPDAVARRWDRWHNLNFEGACARLLADHLLSLERNLGSISPSALADVAEATVSLVRLVLSGDGDTGFVRPSREQAVRESVLRCIRRNASAPLDPPTLCRLLGISRTRLYRAFRDAGGVARTIRAERLAAARLALANPTDKRMIYQIAECYGFRSAEEFSRAFRREFGCRPSETYRAAPSAPDDTAEATGLSRHL